jgi:DNA-3-methyladenine glycosylase I
MPHFLFCPHCGSKVLANHRFCASCGAKQDFTFLDIGRDRAEELQSRPINFKDLFQKMESTLRKQSSLSKEEFDKEFGRFKNISYRNDTNEELYWKIVQVIFYSGMKAAIVTAKLPAIRKYFADYKAVSEYQEEDIKRIMGDNEVISNEKKIKACIANARKFDDIVKRHGSFATYVESFGDLDKEIVINTLKGELMRFGFLGVRTAYHFMLDMGLNVWKPDRVICRILYRIGLIDNKEDIEKAVRVGREISKELGLPIRYVDIVFVKYGQQGAEEPFGLDNGICLSNNPRCNLCGIKEYCVRRNDH